MGCSASANVSNTLIPKQFQIVTESGKTFSMIFDKLCKVSTIKHHMEMRIASKSDQLRLYIKIEQNEQVQTPQSAATAVTTLNSCSKIFKEFEAKSSIIQEGSTTYKLIELEDDKFVMQYAKLLANNPRIYLAQVKSQNTSNESVSTSVNSNRLRNQTIHIGCCIDNKPQEQDDDAIIIAIQKLEKGEVLPQSQIDILQRGRSTLYKSTQPQQTASPKKQQSEENNQIQCAQNSQSSMPQITIEASS
ncbi:hypothetical protein ABPG74_018075 [Tetrahymena malaccensis]